ncbi:MAG: HAMP domain-containing histidine kinase [Coriobacteriia bacterium]|nr:HAMP domain-containing histidine kinase [Coriobacteriia bacterium]MDI6843951.1 HAMP domain-containing sensor histidine kinase [Anaerosomatales bacterium]GAV31083.1 signal transduction histidine kinase [Coriobacteriaceae bacterium EMTCatB1]
MKRTRLTWQVFLAILLVALASVLVAGLIARRALSSAFAAYLSAYGMHMGPGMGFGRMVLGAAERAFLAGVDRGIVVSAAVAAATAALAAVALARYLVRPLRQLTSGVEAVASGDLAHRVEVSGPAEIEELATAFNTMAESLERSEALRRRMVSDVAHELRNPIAALRAQAEAVAEGVMPLDEARLRSMVQDLEQLSRLVHDLQELAVAEAGALRYEMSQTDLCEIAQREVERAKVLAHEGVEVSLSCSPAPAMVHADEFRIAQAVRNLLANALRHTTRGRIAVTVESIDGWMRLTVSDTGSGIPEKDLPYIFERFYRADEARAASTGGTGLGLAIVKRIVEDHGGTVFATSVEGVGSAIGFVLPVSPQE